MATFKEVVLKHQMRRDGRYPVSIRLTQNRRSVYISTGLYVQKNQINKKTFEIKDRFVLMRSGKTITEYERMLLEIETEALRVMSAEDLRGILCQPTGGLDYLGYCEDLISADKAKWSHLRSALNIVYEMGIEKMTTNDFTSQFLFRYKQYMDNRVRDILRNGQKVGEKLLSNRAKNMYLIELNKVFRRMQREYNTEYNKVISHDPFIGFEYYIEEKPEKRSLSADELRTFFSIVPLTDATIIAHDILKMSFCLCGLNLIDLLSLKKENYDSMSGRINYSRQKTRGRRSDGAKSSIRIEPEIKNLVEKYKAADKSEYLFDFGGMDASKSSTRNIGMSTDRLCRLSGFRHISPYWMRHTWATIARNDCDISKDDIDLCLNHVGQNKMADVYIRDDWGRIDRANRKVLDYVFGVA